MDMPAPAIYVIAIVGTIGAAIAFKEFVYEPHIVPAIDRWKAEYQAARRRRQEAELYAAQVEVQMTQTQTRGSGKVSNDERSDDDDEPSSSGSGKPMDGKFMTGGLLLRRSEYNSPQKGGDVELDNLVAREVSEWRNDNSIQVLRQRKNLPEHAMDESIHAIPYSPLSPSRTHVVFDPSNPSTPSTTGRVASLPHSPILSPASKLRLLEFDKSIDAITNETPLDSHPIPVATPITRDESQTTQTLYSSPILTPVPAPNFSRSPLVPSSASFTPLAQRNPFSTQVPPASSSPTSPKILPPLSHSHAIPSLSQSYPQELDYEHGLELLSPPSSRAESPFSMAEVSPNEGLRSFSPFSNVSGTRSTSGFSSSVSSPLPVRMNLGNQSFDAVSPLQQPQGISAFLSPHAPSQNPSATNSARSTTYLSFDDDSSDNGVDQTQTYANQGTGTGVPAEGALGRQDTTSPPSTNQLASRTMTPEQIHGLGLTLFPVPPREPRTPGAAATLTSTTVNSVVAIGAGSHDPVYFRASASSSSSIPLAAAGTTPELAHPAAAQNHHHAQLPSDGELSDLDLMSDFATSESDFGNESDSGWSFAGGSQVGGGSAAPSPRLRRGQM